MSACVCVVAAVLDQEALEEEEEEWSMTRWDREDRG